MAMLALCGLTFHISRLVNIMSIDPGGITASDPSTQLEDRCQVANDVMVAVRSQLRPRIGIQTVDSGPCRFISLTWEGSTTLHLMAALTAITPLLVFSLTRRLPGMDEEVLGQWTIPSSAIPAPGSLARLDFIDKLAKQIAAALRPDLQRL